MTLRSSLVAMFALTACEVADLPSLPADVSRADTSGDTSRDTTTRTETREDDSVEDVASDTEPDAASDSDAPEETREDATPDVDEDTATEVDDDGTNDSDDADGPEIEDDTTLDDTTEDTVETEPETVAETTTSTDTTPACESVVTTFTPAASPHVASCSEVVWETNPPTSGPHYPVWAAWQVYTVPVTRGFYVHSLEHGAVVFLYNCPDGCDADVAALTTMLAARAKDPLCDPGVGNRYVVTPDPLLDVRFAASAWGAHLKADCMDVTAMSAFVDEHYAKGPENFCNQGVDVTKPLTDCDPSNNP